MCRSVERRIHARVVRSVVEALDGEKVLVERHVTFYKSNELTYEEPGGNLVTFAQFA